MNLTRTRARYVSAAALAVIVAIILSGPLGYLVTKSLGVQTGWEGAEAFVENYTIVETFTFAFGFLLAFGFLFFFSCLINTGSEDQRPLEFMGLALSCVFAAVVTLNYIIQVSFIPNALDQDEAIITLFAMANPKALNWSLEMYGYGFLGVATLFVAPLFSRGTLQRIIRWLLVVNGISSIGGAVVFSIAPVGTAAGPGIIGYYLWNLLIAVIMVLVLSEFRFGRVRKKDF